MGTKRGLTVLERAMSHVEPEPMSGCWLWTGARVNGYGRFAPSREARSRLAYRVMYEILVGPVPDGKELDHLCRNRACVNPAHLEPVTRRENFRRSPIMNGAKAACWQGHDFTPENTYYRKDRSGRMCRQCNRERMSRKWHGKEKVLKPKAEKVQAQRKTTLDRFEAKVELDVETGCWEWKGAISRDTGYGVFMDNQKWTLAHRWSYEGFIGPIPPKQVIHHKCGRRSCVNPEHLEATTQRGNLMATPTTQAARNVAKVVCIRGHEAFVTDRTGRRYCKECNRLRQRACRSRHKEA